MFFAIWRLKRVDALNRKKVGIRFAKGLGVRGAFSNCQDDTLAVFHFVRFQIKCLEHKHSSTMQKHVFGPLRILARAASLRWPCCACLRQSQFFFTFLPVNCPQKVQVSQVHDSVAFSISKIVFLCNVWRWVENCTCLEWILQTEDQFGSVTCALQS